MRTARFWLVFLALCVVFIIGFAPSPVHADGLSIYPPFGVPGTAFQIQGSGFAANESVALWLQYPDGHTLNAATVNADGSGSAAFVLATNASYPWGSYVVLAHGQSSGSNVWGRLTLGSSGGGTVITGSTSCQNGSFIVPGFIAGETVLVMAQLPNGSVMPTTVSADGSGTISFALPLQTGLPTGTYVISTQGLVSNHQTRDQLSFDGSTLTGNNCSVTLNTAISGGYVPALIPKNIVEYRGPGVYLGTDPGQLNYFDCNWKWRPMGGIIYFLVLGFHPYEKVDVSYEILLVQGRTYYTTLNADQYGNVVFAFNSIGKTWGHYHWWFTGQSASYCGHYDSPPMP
ncbi:MAG: hypothetical protein WCF84_13420 [Anaerolineae bacterium]